MAPKAAILIVSVSSVILGIVLLATSSMVVVDASKGLKVCRLKLKPNANGKDGQSFFGLDIEAANICQYSKYWIFAGAIGIITSVIQIASFVLVWFQKTEIWCLIHLLISLPTILVFGIAVDKGGFQKPQSGKGLALTLTALIDIVFSVDAAVIVYFLDR